MTNQADVLVKIDDRVRLMSALLAATDWPEKAQERQPHGTHAHSRATQKYLEPYKKHEAVQGLQGLLNQGAPLEAIFTLGMQLSWPGLEIESLPRWVPARWNVQIRDFYEKANLAKWWKDENAVWQSGLTEAQKVFKDVIFKPSLTPFFGDFKENLVFIPNISFPTDRDVGIRVGNDLITISTPRLAWGDSPPWPFDEDPGYIHRAALTQYGKVLMHAYLREHADKITSIAETPLPVSDQFRAKFPTWQEQFTTLFVAAAAALYLETHVSKAEANAYVLMERKTQGMVILPGMISVLRRYLSEKQAGRYKEIIDFLPVFPKQLRVANKIVTL